VKIMGKSKDELLRLDPDCIKSRLKGFEILYLYKIFDGYWKCPDGEIPKYHAQLKSGVCSDSFLNSKVILKHENIRKIIAKQLMYKYLNVKRAQHTLDWGKPTHIGGIPNGAKELGDNVADIWNDVEKADLVKQKGIIKMNSILGDSDKLLLVEDVFTKGTASLEAIKSSFKSIGSGRVLPFILSIVNRGGLRQIQTMQSGGFVFNIISLHSIKANEWESSKCPFCEAGSKSIKLN